MIFSAALLTTQCSKRDNPVDPEIPHGLIYDLTFSSTAAGGDIMQDPPGREVIVYTPPGYDESDSATTYPVLYLLHGYGGNQNYFRSIFSVGDLLDEMIFNGEVEPMIVVTPNASNGLGGSFYTNSFLPTDSSQSYAGRMQDYITDEVVPLIDSIYNTIPDKAHRGIAGHSMGGYGALKLAMLRSDLFGSAASMSGPIAFWGDYNPADPGSATYLGVQELLPYVFAENGFTPGDTAAYYAIAPGVGKSLTNMMFAMASAFSPHAMSNMDTTYSHLYVSTTGFVGKVDLPFDANGNVPDTVGSPWLFWMAQDVTALYSAGYGAALAGTDIYIDCGAEDDLGLYGMAQVFAYVAQTVVNEVHIYDGFDDIYPPDHSTLIGERLRNVLEFHSASFNQ